MKKFLLGAALTAASYLAMAQSYYVVVPVYGKGKPSAPQISVAMKPATLPAGMVAQSYSYDMWTALQVDGDPAYDPRQVQWSVVNGALPAGLTLSNGVISGTPTIQNTAGANFDVVATYKTKSGQQIYSIIVNGQALLAKQISTGYLHSCAVTMAGAVKCWGANVDGQLGNGTTSLSGSPTPVQVVGLTQDVAAVATGNVSSCAVLTTGALKCWGSNVSGQLGLGSTGGKITSPAQVSGLTSGVSAVSMSGTSACALLTSGGVKCWGANYAGQLGNGTTTDRNTPVDVTGLTSGVTAVARASDTSCALLTTGGVKCWGYNAYGAVGDGSTSNRLTPVAVPGLSSVSKISGGPSGWHFCAATTGGAALCWGVNTYKQLGDGTTTVRKVPTAVVGLSSGVTDISAGMGHTCAVTTGGAAKCWGLNSQGQLGMGVADYNISAVSDVVGLSSGVASIHAGGQHSCARMTNNAIKCWGTNQNSQLGDGSLADSYTPVNVQP